MQTLGVAICSYRRHIPHLAKLLASIQAQSRQPDEVVVSCSSSMPEDFPFCESDFSFALRVLVHSEKKNAAQNRNAAAACLSTDLVTFFDADDVMHPQRLDFIARAFEVHDIEILMHNFHSDNCSDFVEYDRCTIFRNVLFKCPWGSTQISGSIDDAHVHNAHATVRRKVLEEIRFREEASYHAKEDTVFCTDVIVRYPDRTAYCHDKLSRYSPGGSMDEFAVSARLDEDSPSLRITL